MPLLCASVVSLGASLLIDQNVRPGPTSHHKIVGSGSSRECSGQLALLRHSGMRITPAHSGFHHCHELHLQGRAVSHVQRCLEARATKGPGKPLRHLKCARRKARARRDRMTETRQRVFAPGESETIVLQWDGHLVKHISIRVLLETFDSTSIPSFTPVSYRDSLP